MALEIPDQASFEVYQEAHKIQGPIMVDTIIVGADYDAFKRAFDEFRVHNTPSQFIEDISLSGLPHGHIVRLLDSAIEDRRVRVIHRYININGPVIAGSAPLLESLPYSSYDYALDAICCVGMEHLTSGAENNDVGPCCRNSNFPARNYFYPHRYVFEEAKRLNCNVASLALVYKKAAESEDALIYQDIWWSRQDQRQKLLDQFTIRDELVLGGVLQMIWK